MIKEAIDRILELAKPNEIVCEGRLFADKVMHEIPRLKYAAPLHMNTLTAITDYIFSDTDKCFLSPGRFIIHVEDSNKVVLYQELDQDKCRERLLVSEIDNCKFPFGRWMDMETFMINTQTSFDMNGNLSELLALIGSVVSDAGITQSDDGISQNVTVKTGISLVGKKKIPNPFQLKPFRTFTEVDQPLSSFVFRLKKASDDTVNAALFAADGEAWRRSAILNISEWLHENFKDRDDVIILA